ncbi:hypothetical protein [Parasediminibacterium sp. JCM 36343]|uniref:hypothetical protein n=1 Tax=Parasediminibacterium sp. JCM 36343 TaxID=3374279 RepID=UPI0039786DA6
MLSKIATALFIFFLFASANAQQKDTAFSKHWAGIDSLVTKQNQTKRALEKIDSLYALASQNAMPAQQVKALVYKISLTDKVQENNPNRSIHLLEQELDKKNDATVKAILHGLIAFQYQTYFNQNRWQLYRRSTTINYQKDSIDTWSAEDFHKAIAQHYLLSIEPAAFLQQTNLSAFRAIILKGNSRELRPTLYDLLAHQALDYFKTGEAYITKPAYAFELNDANALQPAPLYANAVFASKDSASLLLASLQLFQQLIAFHQSQKDTAAEIDVDLERIEWVKQFGVMEGKDSLYKKALEAIIAQYPHHPQNLQAWYLLAKLEKDKAAGYSPFGDTANRWGNVKALKIIKQALPDTSVEAEGYANLKNLATEIKQKSLRVETEQVNVIGKPFRALVKYKNTDTAYCKIINISHDNEIPSLSTYEGGSQKDIWQYINKLPVLQSFSQ